MKFLKIFTITILIFQNSLFAQRELDTMYYSHIKQSLPISIDAKSATNYDLYIETISKDEIFSKDVGIIISSGKRYDKFITAFKSAKEKYIEWQETAKQNGVKTMNKRLNIVNRQDAFFYSASKRIICRNVDLFFVFSITENNGESVCLLLVGTTKLKSSNNQFITHDGGMLVFKSADEIENFINKISEEKLNTFLSDSKNTEKVKDLFQD